MSKCRGILRRIFSVRLEIGIGKAPRGALPMEGVEEGEWDGQVVC